MSATTKLTLRVSTVGAVAGDEISVDAETAKYLVENGHAFPVKAAAKSDKD